MARNQWQFGECKIALDNMEICSADSAHMYPHEQFALPGNWPLGLDSSKRLALDGTGFRKLQCIHIGKVPIGR